MMRRCCITTAAVIGILLGTAIDVDPAEPMGAQDVTNRITVLPIETAPSSEEVSTTTTDVLRRAEDALMTLDAEGLVSLYAADFLFEDTSAGVRITDKTELRSYFDRLFSWPDVGFPNASYFGLGQRAAGEWTMEGRSELSGERFSIRGASLFKIEGGRISEEIIFYDPRPTLQ